MGTVYRKSKQVAPGIRATFSKSGLSSVSFGGKGARMTFGGKRTTTSFGIPGTGFRYQTSSSSNPQSYTGKSSNTWGCATILLGIFLFVGFLMGGNPDWAVGSVLVLALLYFIFSGKFIRFAKRIVKKRNL